MIDITVKITAIIMYCDESILNIEMENYVRQTIVTIIQKAKSQLAIDNTKTWIDIKNNLMNELISEVENKKAAGILLI